ncbi:ankyrin repeat domain-containing protein [Polaribacter sp. 11A2H]|uniref:ankyrin repeat domain-containing protein n=1 Tax=Polaribacter sp. 11A2H TaxID=2687290 RepID=UPI00140AB9DA|nr:ankyrin repeat domain-containing protein [Polaribacter sp. 11A2H]
MKKIILSMFVCLFAFSSINASTPKVLKSNKIISAKTYSNVNAFCRLIQMGNYEAVKALIETGQNVNTKSTGLTPLMFAARHNKAKIAQLLIDNGAKLDIKSSIGNMTALLIGKRSKAVDAIKVIREAL